MSQALADFVSAGHDAIVAVLEMLTAEWQLSDEHSSALDVTGAECEVDVVAARLAEATEALDLDRRPVGWNVPPAVTGDVRTARRRFAVAALRCISAQYAPESAHADAESEYADELLCLAARGLAAEAAARDAVKAETGGRLL